MAALTLAVSTLWAIHGIRNQAKNELSATEPSWRNLFEEVRQERLADFAAMTDGVWRPREQQYDLLLHERGTSREHYQRMRVLALNLNKQYVAQDGSPISGDDACKRALSGVIRGAFHRREWPREFVWWLNSCDLGGTGPVVSAFWVKDDQHGYGYDLRQAASAEWLKYAAIIQANGAPGIVRAGWDALRNAESQCEKCRDVQQRKIGGFCQCSSEKTTGEYTVTVTIHDWISLGDDDPPASRVEFEFAYTPDPASMRPAGAG